MQPMSPVDPTDVRGGDPWTWRTLKSRVVRGWPSLAGALVVFLFPHASWAWYVGVGLVLFALVEAVRSHRVRARTGGGSR